MERTVEGDVKLARRMDAKSLGGDDEVDTNRSGLSLEGARLKRAPRRQLK
jgi:hypothetical protein